MSLNELMDADRGLVPKLGIKVLEMTAEYVRATMPVEGNTQPYGLLHGGASAALIETLASIGAAYHAQSMGKVAVGMELQVSHLSPVLCGEVKGEAHAIHLGKTSALYDVTITHKGRTTATGKLRCALIEPRD